MPGADATWSLLAGQAPFPLIDPPQTPKPVQRDSDTHFSHRSKMPQASCFAEIAWRYRQDNAKYPPALCKPQAPRCGMPGERSGHWTTVSPLTWGSCSSPGCLRTRLASRPPSRHGPSPNSSCKEQAHGSDAAKPVLPAPMSSKAAPCV